MPSILKDKTVKFAAAGLVLCAVAPALMDVAITRVKGIGKPNSETVTVCGNVVSARKAIDLRGEPTFLTLGKAYAGQDLTVVILGENRAGFDAPEALIGRRLCVSGVVRSFFGTPRMLLTAVSG